MHIHFLGIGGTLMGNLALLAKQLGHEVSGSDEGVYPPMSDQLKASNIHYFEGYSPANLRPKPDLVVIGNALSRGNSMVEAILNSNITYTSGAQWLAEAVLKERWVLAVSGTHGKTTTASMLAWILEYAGVQPGYLIGGVARNFTKASSLGSGKFFVVEADEYDTAFFDKRSKFVHYRPKTLIINNLEFDHGDIFPDLAAIQTQFHHLIRTVPSEGIVIRPHVSEAIDEVLTRGCWTPVTRFAVQKGEFILDGVTWMSELVVEDGSVFNIVYKGEKKTTISWSLLGEHNLQNALAAIAAAYHVGIPIELAGEALSQFVGVKRRQEVIGKINGITIYDDFAHHPTAIEVTLNAIRKKVGDSHVIAVIEPRSNTMRLGSHQAKLATVCNYADQAIWLQPNDLTWDLTSTLTESKTPTEIFDSVDNIVQYLVDHSKPGDHIVIMSNGGFDGIHKKLKRGLEEEFVRKTLYKTAAKVSNNF